MWVTRAMLAQAPAGTDDFWYMPISMTTAAGVPVSADTAMRLERVFGASAEFWLRLQASHDLEVARRGSAKRIRAETTPLTANRPT